MQRETLLVLLMVLFLVLLFLVVMVSDTIAAAIVPSAPEAPSFICHGVWR